MWLLAKTYFQRFALVRFYGTQLTADAAQQAKLTSIATGYLRKYFNSKYLHARLFVPQNMLFRQPVLIFNA
jgi:hypothetical protein